MPDALTIALACAKAADAIQAEEIMVIDLRGLSSIADYFVVCTATSVPHLKAVSREIQHGVSEALGEKPRTSEGDASSMWLVIDYVDVIVHIFHSEKRYFYAIEDLWADAQRVPLELEQLRPSDRIAS